MLKEISDQLARRKDIIEELYEISLDGKRLSEEEKKIEDEFFSGEINSLEYERRMQKYEQFDWFNNYITKISQYLIELQKIDSFLVSNFSQIEKVDEFKRIFPSLESINKSIKEKKREFEEIKQGKRGFEAVFGESLLTYESVNRKVLEKYQDMLRKYRQKLSSMKEIEIKKIDWNQVKKSGEILYLSKEDFKNLNLLDKIKYWYYRKYVLPKLLRKKREKRVEEEVEVIGKTKDVEVGSLLQLVKLGKEKREKEKEMEKRMAYSVDEEMFALNKLLKEESEKETKEFRLPVWFMYIVNLFASKFNIYLIKQFPGFFERLYLKIQMANLKILPSVYINLLIFTTFFSAIILSIIGFFVGLFVLKMPIPVAFGFAWFVGLITAAIVCLSFYNYPDSVIKDRKKSIERNLPFAIIHMSSIASSGAVPLKMFELVAEKKRDFEAISEEFSRILQYVNIFGADLVTAIKQTTELTPSPQLREFLNGLITSIESGGDLTIYLTVKANEILEDYRILREKVNYNVSVFSELYLGIMITAPVFFVLILGVMGFLGATIRGLSAPMLLAIFTYIIFPLLNLIFYYVLDNILVGY